MAENYSYGTIPARTNPKRVLEVKILNTLNGGGTGGGGSGFGPLSQGAGPPLAPPANTSATAFYVDTNVGVTYYWNTSTQAWT